MKKHTTLTMIVALLPVMHVHSFFDDDFFTLFDDMEQAHRRMIEDMERSQRRMMERMRTSFEDAFEQEGISLEPPRVKAEELSDHVLITIHAPLDTSKKILRSSSYLEVPIKNGVVTVHAQPLARYNSTQLSYSVRMQMSQETQEEQLETDAPQYASPQKRNYRDKMKYRTAPATQECPAEDYGVSDDEEAYEKTPRREPVRHVSRSSYVASSGTHSKTIQGGLDLGEAKTSYSKKDSVISIRIPKESLTQEVEADVY